jgi:uncharacterized integral membrane protein
MPHRLAAGEVRISLRSIRAAGGTIKRPANLDQGRTTPMIRKFLRALVMIPAFVALALLAMANQRPVTVSFDPFDASDTQFAVTVPLYVLGFTILIAGVLLGGFAAWLNQGRHRKLGGRVAAENVMVRTELASLKGRAVRPEGRSLTARRAG